MAKSGLETVWEVFLVNQDSETFDCAEVRIEKDLRYAADLGRAVPSVTAVNKAISSRLS